MNLSSKNAYQKILDEDVPYQSSLQMLVEYYGKTVNVLHGEFLDHYHSLIYLVGHNVESQNPEG